jgi:hypothetical protein
MHKDPVFMETTIQIGATGAVTSFVGAMVQSVTRLSTGVYKIAFQTTPSPTNFPRLLAAIGSPQSPVSGLSGIDSIEIQNAPNTSVSSTTAPSLTIKTLNPSGALTDPANGSAINLLMIMGNSSVTIQGD